MYESHQLRDSHPLTLAVTASGISGPKAEPDSEDATELKKKLWDNESFEEWGETYNTYVQHTFSPLGHPTDIILSYTAT